MAAVIRVKRRLEDQPTDTLILNCKKRKTDENGENEESELSTILKFAGTIDKQEDIYSHLKKPTKIELEEQFKKHNIDLSAKLRNQKQLDSKKSRYKVVNCYRSNASNIDESSAEDLNKSDYTIYDLETDSNENQVNTDSGANYVYDVYYTTSDDLGDASFEDYVRCTSPHVVLRLKINFLYIYSMYPYNTELMYGSMRDNGLNEPDSDDDSEDSNAENNWRNDYPDESDMESVTEDDMLAAMKRCDLSDLSSDDGEEGFVYSVDSEATAFEEDIDDSDVQRYGERYARFKARNKKGVETTSVNHDLYYGDIDEEEYYY